MTNRTRLDSLRVGERFRFTDNGYNYVHLGAHADGGQVYQKESGNDLATFTVEGSRMVYPLDPPPPVPSKAALSAIQEETLNLIRRAQTGGLDVGDGILPHGPGDAEYELIDGSMTPTHVLTFGDGAMVQVWRDPAGELHVLIFHGDAPVTISTHKKED